MRSYFVRICPGKAHLTVLITSIFALIAFPTALSAAPLPDGLKESSIRVDGTTRYYLTYKADAPRTFSAAVVLLHGGGQSMRKLFGPRRAGTLKWLDIAAQNNILLIAPNGVDAKTGDPKGDKQSWNDLRRSREVGNSQSDDVGFIGTLISHLAGRHSFDPTKVYVTGASNGGMMTYRMLIERPDRFAAGVAFIANLPVEAISTVSDATPIMIMNGTEDKLILYDGGPVAGGRRGETRSTQDTLDYWIALNRADRAQSKTRTLPDLDPKDGCRLIETTYPAAQDGAEVVFVKMDGGGHTIPAKDARPMRWLANRVLGPQCRDADGAALAWEFMRRHQLESR